MIFIFIENKIVYHFLHTDEINDSGSFFNSSPIWRVSFVARWIFTFEFGAIFN